MSFLVLDCGTSASKAAVVAEDGRILALSRRPITVRRPGPGQAEIDADELWASAQDAARAALRKAPRAGRDVQALGVSALLGYVFLDGKQRPLGPAVIWMDNRAAAEAEEIRGRLSEEAVYARTGRRISPELLAPKLLWYSRHHPGLARCRRLVIGLKDELVRRLCGAVQTDVAHLDYSLLFNIHQGRLDPDLLTELGIDPTLFPEPRRATDVVGRLTLEAARGLGLPAGLPVISGSSDGTTAMYGGGVLESDVAVLVAGTTDVCMTASPYPVQDPTLTLTVNTGQAPGLYLAGGAMGLAGGALRRLEELLSVSVRSRRARIRRLPPGSDGLLVFPGFSGERSPYWQKDFTGGLIGLTLGHRPEHVFRAAMEAAAYRVRRLVELLAGCGLAPTRINVTGGFADLDVWNHIRADVTGIEHRRPRVAEATVLGTAMFCRAALDGRTTLAELSRQWIKIGRRYRPDSALTQEYRARAELFDEFIHSTAGFYRRLGRVRN
ncbi:MAG: FGGY family carbohydrate kinase [Thermodesulfobacteriota bacterium]